MIEFDRTLGLAFVPALTRVLFLLCLFLCLVQVVEIHGNKHGDSPIEIKTKDSARYGSKKQLINSPTGQKQPLALSPEMLLLSGSQRNDLNLVPIKVDAPKELYMTGPEEKPIVISVSNDKQVLSEENRMLPKPILIEGNLTNSEFLRNFWLKLNNGNVKVNGSRNGSASTINSVQRSSVSGASPLLKPSVFDQGTDRESMVPEKPSGSEQVKWNEMRANLAAIDPSKDFEAAIEASSSDPKDNFNQSLSSDQLLGVIYKLLTLYKPDFNSCPPGGPCTATRPRIPKVSPLIVSAVAGAGPSTLRPIDNILYHLAVSKAAGPLKYRSPWNYQTSPPKEFGNDMPLRRVLSDTDGRISARKVANILDSLPLIRTFNEYRHLPGLLPMDKDTFAESFPASSCSDLCDSQKYRGGTKNHQGGGEASIDGPNDGRAFPRASAAMLREYVPSHAEERDNNVSIIDSRYIENHGIKSRNDIKEMLMVASNMTAKHRLLPNADSPSAPEETYNFYSKLLRQLQGKGEPFSDHWRLEHGTANNNHSLAAKYRPLLDLSTELEHSRNLNQRNSKDCSHELSPSIADKTGVEINVVNKPVSAYYDRSSRIKNKDPLVSSLGNSGLDFSCHSAKHSKGSFKPKDRAQENFDLDNRILVDSKPSCLQLKNLAEVSEMASATRKDKRRRKLQLKFKRRSKEEQKKKAHESLDFLDLLSKSMLRESKNFEGRI